jgi:hypothetical protein
MTMDLVPGDTADLASAPSVDAVRRYSAESTLLVGAGVMAAVFLGAVLTQVPPTLAIAGIGAAVFVAAVAWHPPLAAYALVGLTPLVAGIDRGAVIPVLRPSEAIALLAASGLVLRALARAKEHPLVLPRLRRTDITILLLAITGSILPLLWMTLRGAKVTGDDMLYALVVWKFYALYVIVRCSIRTAAQTRVALYSSMIAGCIVAVIAIFQALHLFGVAQFLQHYYAAYGDLNAVLNNRGGATLSLPIAVADLLSFNLAIAFGLMVRGASRRERLVLSGMSILFVAGVLAAGELSGVIALVVACVALVWLTRRGRAFLNAIPVVLVLGWLMQPVLQARLADVDNARGLPVSWVGRLDNLRTFFLPPLFSGYNFILGIRPSARIATAKFASGWVWIECGYAWLLWAGGIPLLLAFIYFIYVNVRDNLDRARYRSDAVGVASLALVVSLVVISVCMVFDPHLTYRGSADLMFALLALATVRTPLFDRPPSEPDVALDDQEVG